MTGCTRKPEMGPAVDRMMAMLASLTFSFCRNSGVPMANWIESVLLEGLGERLRRDTAVPHWRSTNVHTNWTPASEKQRKKSQVVYLMVPHAPSAGFCPTAPSNVRR